MKRIPLKKAGLERIKRDPDVEVKSDTSQVEHKTEFHHRMVRMLSVPVTYKRQRISSYKGNNDYVLRRYFVGVVQIALMYVFDTPQSAGKYCVHIASQPKSGGVWFNKRRRAEALIFEELEKVPT